MFKKTLINMAKHSIRILRLGKKLSYKLVMQYLVEHNI